MSIVNDILDHLAYDPDTGKLYEKYDWRDRPAGSEVGCVSCGGRYRSVLEKKEGELMKTITIQHPTHEVPMTMTVTHYWHQEPDATSWASDMDYYGFTEIEYEVEPVDGIPEEELYSEAVTEAVLAAYEANGCAE